MPSSEKESVNGKKKQTQTLRTRTRRWEEDRSPLKRVREIGAEPEAILRSLMSRDKKNMTANSVKDRRSQDEHRDRELLDLTVHSAIISDS